MKRQLIEQRFKELDEEIKESQISLELALHTELIPSEEDRNEIRKIVKELGLELKDFSYTGFDVYPFRYYKEVVMVDIMDFSKEHMIFISLIERYQKFRDHCISVLMNNNFEAFFSILDKRIGMDAFIIMYKDVAKIKRYGIFRDLFCRMEFGFRDLDIDFLEEIFTYRIVSDDWKDAMTELLEEIENKDTITIYRGVGTKSQEPQDAYSWTLSQETAQWFANRFNSNGEVYAGEVMLEDILDYITNRNEKEILVKPNTVQNIRRI